MRQQNRTQNQKYISNPAMMPQVFTKRSKSSSLSNEEANSIDYKNIRLLKKFVSERGKMIPRRISAVSSKKQRELSKAIKNARILALLPYVDD